eukprot:m.153862 g.153862  ORF g.153862 m.153862 type:complete len:593 (-) comp15074_c0_seq2:112-1890(-)
MMYHDTLDSELEAFTDTEYAKRGKAFKQGGSNVLLSRQGRIILTSSCILLVVPLVFIFKTQQLTSAFYEAGEKWKSVSIYHRGYTYTDWYVSPVFYLTVDVMLTTILVWTAFCLQSYTTMNQLAAFFRTLASSLFRFLAMLYFLITLCLGIQNRAKTHTNHVLFYDVLWGVNVLLSFVLATIRLLPKHLGKFQMSVVFILMGLILIIQGAMYARICRTIRLGDFDDDDDDFEYIVHREMKLLISLTVLLLLSGICMVAISSWFNYQRYLIKRVAYSLLKYDTERYSNVWKKYKEEKKGITEVALAFKEVTKNCPKHRLEQPCTKLSEIYQLGSVANVFLQQKIFNWQSEIVEPSSNSKTSTDPEEMMANRCHQINLKDDQRTMEKIQRLYFGNVSLITDVVRGSVICPDLSAVARALEIVNRDPDVTVCRGKNRFTSSDAKAMGGYRDVQLNIRLCNFPDDIVGAICKDSLEQYIVELQIHLEEIHALKMEFEEAPAEDSVNASNNSAFSMTGRTLNEKLLKHIEDKTSGTQELVEYAKKAFLPTHALYFKQLLMSPEERKQFRENRKQLQKYLRRLSGHDRYKIKRYLLAE